MAYSEKHDLAWWKRELNRPCEDSDDPVEQAADMQALLRRLDRAVRCYEEKIEKRMEAFQELKRKGVV